MQLRTQLQNRLAAQVALLTPKAEVRLPKLQLLTPKTEHESLLDRVAASELTNTALQERISQLQAAVVRLSLSVLDHRAAFDSLADRQASEPGAWEGSESGIYAGYLRDNAIPVPVFNWPWIPRRYTTTNIDAASMAIETFTRR